MKNTHTLLIAEDEQEIRDLLVERLDPLGYPISVATDGEDMLRQLCTKPEITAVLSDIKMPRMTGLEVLKEARILGLETPIVFLTAFGDKRMVIEALRFGALDFLEKPWSDKSLVAAIQQAMELGIKLKSLDDELDVLAKKYQVRGVDVERFKALQKPLLRMKLGNEVFFKKKAS